MNREEFLKLMREALDGKVPERTINENLEYYRNYINNEVSRGRSEVDVLRELGDPRLLAKTIEESCKHSGSREEHREGQYGRYSAGYGQRSRETVDNGRNDMHDVHITSLPSWLLAIIVILIVVAVVCVILRIFVALLPVIAVVIAAVGIYRLIKYLFE